MKIYKRKYYKRKCWSNFWKERYSFNFDNLFSLDCTEISRSKQSKQKGLEPPKYQIELELKNNSLQNKDIINKMTYIFKNILGNINS